MKFKFSAEMKPDERALVIRETTRMERWRTASNAVICLAFVGGFATTLILTCQACTGS